MTMVGRVTPPADMVEAARKSLSSAGFEALMRRLHEQGRTVPTPRELCAAVNVERYGNGDRNELDPEELKA